MSGLDMIPPRPEWTRWAACRGLDTNRWYPERGESVDAPREVCRACPARRACISESMEQVERHGMWGGLSNKHRRLLRRDGEVALGRSGDIVMWDEATGEALVIKTLPTLPLEEAIARLLGEPLPELEGTSAAASAAHVSEPELQRTA